MCGRFVITSPPAAVRAMFDYPEMPNFPPRYNIAPTQPVPVVMLDGGVRHFRLMRWGFLPAWVKDPRTFTLVINARAETALEKPAFRNAIKRRRCLIPADGYYEWRNVSGQKHPYFIAPHDGGPIGLAALAETWAGPNGEELDTAAIVTTAAAADMAVLHHRVPVPIARDDFGRWLDCAGVSAEQAATLLAAPQIGEFVWHRVSRAVNRVANDDAQLLLPISDAQIAEEMAASAARAVMRKPATAAKDDGQGSLFE